MSRYTGRKRRMRTATRIILILMLAAAVVYPDLQNAELQDSYGVTDPEDLLYEMIDNPGEFNDLAAFVQQYSGLDETMEEKVQEAKN